MSVNLGSSHSRAPELLSPTVKWNKEVPRFVILEPSAGFVMDFSYNHYLTPIVVLCQHCESKLWYVPRKDVESPKAYLRWRQANLSHLKTFEQISREQK